MAHNPWWATAIGATPGVSVVGAGRTGSIARWTAAVALGGQGRYAAAAALLDGLLRDPRTPVAIRAHALVTRASHVRQQGGHRLAEGLDGRALALAVGAGGRGLSGLQSPAPQGGDRRLDEAGGPGAEPGGGPCADLRSAAVDALVGLAADGLGRGDLADSERLLNRADALLGDAGPWRPRVRWNWVRTEVGLARGDLVLARGAAAAAVSGSAAAGSLRHLLKSRLLGAVVAAVEARDPAGGAVPPVAARSSAVCAGICAALLAALADLDNLAAETADAGLLPLSWAALLAAADTADALRAACGVPSATSALAARPGPNPPPSVIVGPGVDGRPPAGTERPSDRPIGSPALHDRRQEGMRESVNGAVNDAAHRRHAAALALSDIRARSEAVGRRLMGGVGTKA